MKMNKEDICFMPAWEMRDKIKSQELTSQEITEAVIERIEKINPTINAYCTPAFESAREMAKDADRRVNNNEKLGLLNGIPTSIKDLMYTKGIRTTFGSKIYEDFIPDEDEIAVQRLKDAGCVILGKTNTPEFGAAGVTYNPVFGETKNPWKFDRTSGGSSGGAAVATVSGISPLALGSDGGGSIRHPACLCGAYGLKPHFGRVPMYPSVGIAGETFSCYGPIVRFVKDAALMLDVLAGPHNADRYSLPAQNISYYENVDKIPQKLKVGYSLDLGYAKIIDTDVEKSFFEAIEKLKKYDWQFEEITIKLRKPHVPYLTFHTAMPAYDLKSKLTKYKDVINEELLKMINAGYGYDAMAIMQAMALRNKVYEAFFPIFEKFDVLLTPTTATTAFKLGQLFPMEINGKAAAPLTWMPYTYIFNLTQHPAATIPSGFSSEGLPIGLQIVGRRFDELTVLQVSKAFENVAPWQEKKPQF
jgi:Asp-tRNA(Asn)/Glu-tRNA(Gln) amidotransferase A subunit family amidase